MVTKHFKQLLLAFAVLPLLAQPALAHVVWFDRQGDEYELLFGHPESGPEYFDLSKFRSATGYDLNKQVVPLEINRQDGVAVVPQGDVAALTAFYDNGYWLRNPGDSSSRNISQAEAEAINYANVTNNVKYTKALYDWSETISQPFGLPLEIMPLQNPFEVTLGESLPIRVSYQGNLIQDALVEYLGETVNVNSDGTYSIPVGEGGLQPIEASYTSPTATNPRVNYATTLTAQSLTAAQSVPEPSALLGLGALSLLGFIRKSSLKQSICGARGSSQKI